MKIVRYISAGGPQFGCIHDDDVYSIEGPPSRHAQRGSLIAPLSSVHLTAPCRPSKIIALAINFHGATGLTETMKEPLVFLKAGTSACGPYDDVVSPFPGINVWGECEIAIVIGERGSILGYTAANDVSADNIEGWDHHLARSKSADTFCPLGPWIDTEYSPANRLIEGLQNGKVIRRGNSDDRLWCDARAVEWLSTWMTLEPWDVILTGAPTRIVPRRYLKENDEYVVRIDGLGELRNRFREKPAQ